MFGFWILWPLSGAFTYAFMIRKHAYYTLADFALAIPMAGFGPFVLVALLLNLVASFLMNNWDRVLWDRRKD